MLWLLLAWQGRRRETAMLLLGRLLGLLTRQWRRRESARLLLVALRHRRRTCTRTGRAQRRA